MTTGATDRHVPQLDGLRGLAVLMVFLYHALLIPLLWSGVDLFFILSGYLITNILLRDREALPFGAMLQRFYLRRAVRILPAYVLFLVFVTIALHVHWQHTWGYYVFFLQNVPYALHQEPAFAVVPLWSLAVEQHFYLLWPPLVFFLPRRWLVRAMFALLVAEPLLRALCTPLFRSPDPIYCLTPFRLDALAAGALAALLLPHVNRLRTLQWARAATLLGGLALVVLSAFPWFRRAGNTALVNALLYTLNIVTLGGLFVVTVLSRNTWLTRVLSLPAIRGLGRISYMFYLLHLTVLIVITNLVSAHAPLWMGKAGVAIAAFCITSVLATMSWLLVERPALSLPAGPSRTLPDAARAAYNLSKPPS